MSTDGSPSPSRGIVPRLPFRTVDGSTCRAIQAAIDDLGSGGTVVLPPGHFTVDETILLTDGVTVVGTGRGRSILELAPGSGCHVFSNADHSGGNRDVGLSSFSVLGNGSSQERPSTGTALSFCNAAYFKGVRGVRVADVAVYDIRQTGLHLNACVDVSISDFIACRVGWSGVSTSGTDDISVKGLFVKNAGLDDVHSGVHIDGGHGVQLIDGWISDCTGNAVMLDSAFGALSHAVLSCICRRSKRGIALSGSGHHDLRDVVIRGGVYSENREVGILLSNTSHVTVTGALVEENPEHGILLQGRKGACECTIDSCTLIGNGTGIAEVHESSHNGFLENRFFSNETDLRLKSPPARRQRQPSTDQSPAVPERSSTTLPRDEHGTGPEDYPSDSYDGRCWVCGHEGSFRRVRRAIRETYACESCRANLRYQAQGAVLVQRCSRDGATSVAELVTEPEFRSLAIYEPGVLGPFRSLFRSLPRYSVSDFWPDVPPGQERDGIRCESLMGLTHPDGIFDLVITSDIFEHVRDPYKGFAEVARVLRKGGVHIFSIPVLHPLPETSVARVDTSGPDDVFIQEARYHLGPGNSQHIVYTDFGADLCQRLADIGLSTDAVRFPSSHGDLNRVVTFCSIKEE